MNKKFWLDRWQANEIGFHKSVVNSRLVRHWPAVGADPLATVFVPLCGKTLDMRWLEQHGHPVIGIELAALAVEAYFAEGNETPVLFREGALDRYVGAFTTLYCGNFFELPPVALADVGAVYDRGALVALPPEMRPAYVQRLVEVVPAGARMLLLTVQYDQALVAGPPFAVHETEIADLFGGRCRVTLLERASTDDVSPRLRASGAPVTETAHLIVKET